MKMRDQLAGVENEGKVSMESQFVKKCLKAVVFMCWIIPSLHVYLINECKKKIYCIITDTQLTAQLVQMNEKRE